jgi:hypothetical protein
MNLRSGHPNLSDFAYLATAMIGGDAARGVIASKISNRSARALDRERPGARKSKGPVMGWGGQLMSLRVSNPLVC